MPAGYTDAGSYTVQFKASAANHNDAYGTFKVTITPAPLAVTINNVEMDYTGEALTPSVTPQLTTRPVKEEINPVTFAYRDEASEWGPDIPSFTDPGEYTLYVRATAPNHTEAIASCTVTVKGWDYKVNLDGETGFRTPILISNPKWLIQNNMSAYTGEQLSVADTRYQALDATCPNGLKLWHNYVIDRTDRSKKLVAAVMQRGDRVEGNAFVVHFPGVEALKNTGLDVSYRLDKKLRGTQTKSEFAASAFTEGELSNKYEMNIPLDGDDPTGLYVFNIVLTPTDPDDNGQAVLASVATVGVLRVSCPMTNTVTAVPWQLMSSAIEADQDIPVADLVNPNGIDTDDLILSYNPANKTFNAWANGEQGWNELVTASVKGVTIEPAESTTLARGSAFWLVRAAPGDCFYLIGRHTGEDYVVTLNEGTAAEPGNTLCANPTLFDIDLNDLTFVDGAGQATVPGDNDRIVTQNIIGIQLIHTRKNGAWGRYVSKKVNNRIRQVWTEGGTIPAGTGFWYTRTTEGTLKIRFTADK